MLKPSLILILIVLMFFGVGDFVISFQRGDFFSKLGVYICIFCFVFAFCQGAIEGIREGIKKRKQTKQTEAGSSTSPVVTIDNEDCPEL